MAYVEKERKQRRRKNYLYFS